MGNHTVFLFSHEARPVICKNHQDIPFSKGMDEMSTIIQQQKQAKYSQKTINTDKSVVMYVRMYVTVYFWEYILKLDRQASMILNNEIWTSEEY